MQTFEPLEPAVAAVGLRVSRGGRRVLHGLDFSVARGRITGLLGPSGCGKTTLMRAIVGVQIVETGDVRVLGSPAGSPAVRPRVGYMMQTPAVYQDLSARENLRYFARVLRAPAARVGEMLELVQLDEHADRPVRNLSGGQRARVSLGTALLGEPDVLVLDEPTVGLDPVLREDLWRTFHEIAEGGATLLVSSHVMDEAARCDDLLLMRDGRLLADLTPAELRERTGEEHMERAFLRLIEREAVTA
jgi:ABC-2 type transport system ATP-binding protein